MSHRVLGTVVLDDCGNQLLRIPSEPSEALVCLRDLYARTQSDDAYLPSHPAVMRDAVLAYIDKLEESQ